MFYSFWIFLEQKLVVVLGFNLLLLGKWWPLTLTPARHWATKHGLVHHLGKRIMWKEPFSSGTVVYVYASMKHQRPYPRANLQSVFCNWNLEFLSSLVTGEPSHASLCPFLIILLVIKTCWQAKPLSWVGAPLINLSSFPGHIMLFSLPFVQSESVTSEISLTRIAQRISEFMGNKQVCLLWILIKLF